MKIRSLHIGSFGKLRDVHVNDIPEGLTVITGKNESGKTTTMEFMRRAMFPVSRRKDLYPTPSDNDNGSLELESAGQLNMIIEVNGKKVTEKSNKPLPPEMFSMDADAYRSMFAMDLKDLVEKDEINKVRQKLLTIPGGDSIPSIIDGLKGPKGVLMSEERLGSTNLLKTIMDRIAVINDEIVRAKATNQQYDVYSKELEALEAERKRLTGESGAIAEKNQRYKVLNSQIANIETYDKLNERRAELEYSSSITDEMVVQFNDASGKKLQLENLKNDDAEQMSEEKVDRMRTLNKSVNAVLNDTSKAERITQTREDISVLKGQLAAINKVQPVQTPVVQRRNGPSVFHLLMILVGIGIVAGGFVVNQTILMGVGAMLAAVGIILYLMSSRSDNDRIVTTGYRDNSSEIRTIEDQIDLKTKELEGLEHETISVQHELRDFLTGEGMEYKGLSLGMLTLTGMIATADSLKARSELVEKTKAEIVNLNERMDVIAEPYGGRDRFITACRDRSELGNVIARMNTIRTSVEAAVGVTMESARLELTTSAPVEIKDVNAHTQSEMIGKLSKQMADIRQNNDVGMKENELNAKRKELADKAKEWAVLAMQGTLIDNSCTELYSKMQPSVIKTANQYLSIMTDNRYEIISDPRMTDVMIRDRSGLKKDGEWSSGLRDQVYLSLKMAIAKEMGSERLPMILDDVLVRFDETRRKGACAAILEFAKDQQVFLFSCDSSLPDDFPPGSEFGRWNLDAGVVTKI